VISLRQVGFIYAGSDQRVISEMTLDIARGQTLAVVGPNGSGKSTLALLMNGLLFPTEGSVTVDGLPTTDPASKWDVRSRVGVVFQNPDAQIVGTVVEEDVAFGPENLGVSPEELRVRVDSALCSVGLSGLERREPHLLSGGQKQRLAIAGVLALQPKYIVMDEPTAMLDPSGRNDVLEIIARLREEGTGIVHITHHIVDLVFADRVLALSDGQIAFFGEPIQLFTEDGLLERLGLTVPPIYEMASRLRRLGLPIPPWAMDADTIVGAL